MSNYVLFLCRFILCTLFSMAIGYERNSRNQFGVKLYMLVATGTFLFVSFAVKETGVNSARIAAQIVSGISFLGTGAIIINNNELKGLNVAATMWCITAIGILTGFGYIFEAMIGTIAVILINRFVNGSKNISMNVRNMDIHYLVKICYFDNVNIDNKLLSIKNNINSIKIRKMIILRYNICILDVSGLDYFKMGKFVEKMNCDNDIKSISFDMC